jgi:flagella basal body P-ring formation protein FlgA
MKKLMFFIKIAVKILLLSLIPLNHGLASTQAIELNQYTSKQITAKAVAYVQELFPQPQLGELSFQAVPLDRRIKIKPCADELKMTIPGSATLNKRTTVQVSCQSLKHWNIYVQVKVKKMIPMVVARGNLAPGTLITHSNVSVILKDASQVRGRSLTDPAPLFGAKTSRYITSGQAVTQRQICLVCKGDHVTVIARIKGLQVKTSGISQQNGSLGDNIAILNTRTSKRIKARVVAVNKVEINI